MNSAKLKKFSPITLSIILLGCSLWKSTFKEFNAYFNTYYNAKVTFEEVEEVLKNNYLAEKFPTFENIEKETKLKPNEKNKLDDVIKKCSKILQYYLNTSISDDALLMIGKSYLYQDNFLGAERKFAELITTFYNSKLYDEALYYLMLTLSKEKKYNDVIISFQTKARNDPKNKNLWKLQKIYAFAKFRLGEIDSAIHYLNLALEKAKGEDKAEILFYLGELNEDINPQKSAESYRSASKTTKRTNLKTYSLIKYAIQQRKLGNFELVEKTLNDLLLLNIDKDYERKIYLELARTYNLSDNLDKAIETYTYLDTTYKRTEESTYGYFELGQIYEVKIGRYDSARVFYEKARLEYPQSEASKQAQKKVASLNEYFNYHSIISKNDSIIKFTNPDSTAKLNYDSLKNQIAQAKYSLAWTFYMSLNRIDSAIYYLQDIIKNYPTSKSAPRSYYLLGTIYESIDTTKAREIYLELVNKFPKSEFSLQAIKFLGLKNNFENDTLKELYNKAISLIDIDPSKAIELLSIICSCDSNPTLKAKAYFAIGWINEYKLKNFEKAVEFYTNVLNNFPNTEFAKVAEMKLNPEKYKPQTQPITTDTESVKKAPDEIKTTPKETDTNEDNPRLRERKKRRIDDN